MKRRETGILIESDFYENEIFYYQLRFGEENMANGPKTYRRE